MVLILREYYLKGQYFQNCEFLDQMDSKTYLLFTSCHPRHTKTSLPFSLARRLKVIVSNPIKRRERYEELKEYLKNQKYPKQLINDAIEKAETLNRNEILRENSRKNKEEVIAYVSTFNPRDPELFGKIREDINILKRDNVMKEVLSKYKIIKSKRQPPNLKKLLTRATYTENKKEPEVKRCNNPRCGLCKHILEGKEYKFKNGKKIKVNQTMNCEVKNVIYVIICEGCQSEYIGETCNLRNRVTLHNQHIRDASKRILYVSHHLANCNTNGLKYKIFPMFKMFTDSTVSRKQKEQYFIKTMHPQLNR